MAAGKRLFEFVAKPLTRRSSDSVVVKSASSASEIRKAEESPKLWLKNSRRQLKQDGEFGNRYRYWNKDGSDDFKRILLKAAYREYFRSFLTCACALGAPFGIFCVTNESSNSSPNVNVEF